MAVELVNRESLPVYLERWSIVRGGMTNEDTESEAMFLLVGAFCGPYMLTTGHCVMWTGVQNASARWSDHGSGKPWPSVESALLGAIGYDRPALFTRAQLWYSEDAIERLRWMAEKIKKHKASSLYLLYEKNP